MRIFGYNLPSNLKAPPTHKPQANIANLTAQPQRENGRSL